MSNWQDELQNPVLTGKREPAAAPTLLTPAPATTRGLDKLPGLSMGPC